MSMTLGCVFDIIESLYILRSIMNIEHVRVVRTGALMR